MVKNTKAQPPRRRTTLAFSVALSLWLTGCAHIGAPQLTRSLSPQIELQTQADGSRSWRHGHAKRYQSVHIDPEAISFDPGVSLEPEQGRELREAVVTALRQRFSAAGWRLQSSAAEPETLTIKATITDVRLANTAANILTTLLLIGPLSQGGVTAELQALDHLSQEPVAALAITGRAGFEDIAAAYSATGHARLQADGVAQRFVQLLASTVPPHVAPR